MIPFARIMTYGNKVIKSFKGTLTQITANAGYNPVGRNNTANCSVNTPEYPRVYFYGGLNSAGTFLTDVFYYDMVANRYVQSTGNALGAYRSAAMVYGNDGFVYIWGGANTANAAQNQFARLTVSTNQVNIIANDTNRPVGQFGQSALSYNNFLFFHGGGSSTARETITRYNVTTNAWSTVRTGVTTPSLSGGQSSITFNGKLYFAATDGLYDFNPTTYVLTKMPNQPPNYTANSYSLIVNGEWYSMNNSTTNTVSKYNLDGTWTIINTTNLNGEIFGAWSGYNSSLENAYLLFGGVANERSARIRKLS